ncbi:hypothetical protein H9P43_009318 [Blastocladiella emersonii ATCC 22665]|nr:hypothetical protein H9P43_009318 [Blastocladiella emersonii ATCC 22665]
MPSSALCLGITNNGALPSSLNDASGMLNVAGALGVEEPVLMTDVDSEVPITRESVLESLHEMVVNAAPGDTVLFSFSGMPGEGNGIALPDGSVISDADLQTVLADLPQGANCALVMDSPVEFDFSGMPEGVGNIISMSAANEGDFSFAGAPDSMSPFSAAVMEVMTNPDNAGISWADAAQQVQEQMGPGAPTIALDSNHPEALYESAVPVDETAVDVEANGGAAVIDETEVTEEVVDEEPVHEETEGVEVHVEEVHVEEVHVDEPATDDFGGCC